MNRRKRRRGRAEGGGGKGRGDKRQFCEYNLFYFFSSLVI
jgi:hypothetical protein